MRYLLSLLLLLGLPAHAVTKADLVLVKKSERTLYLMRGGEPLKSFRIALGPRPWGHKQYEGDERTPEGSYLLDFKKADSYYYKAIRISYPNAYDVANARAAGRRPGGNIMIHGFPEKGELPDVAQTFNWTSGCIAVTNEEMDEIWAAVEVGTPIEIHP
jgi:murein L,D-transpeptidase YafK